MLNPRLLENVKPIDEVKYEVDRESVRQVLKLIGEGIFWLLTILGIGVYLVFWFVWMVISGGSRVK